MDSSLQFTEEATYQCFTCLGNTDISENILENPEIRDQFKKTFKLEVQIFDDFSLYFCAVCREKLSLATEFLQQVESSLQCLENYKKSQLEVINFNDDQKTSHGTSPSAEGHSLDDTFIKEAFEPYSQDRLDPPKDETISERSFEIGNDDDNCADHSSDSDNQPLIKFTSKRKRKRRIFSSPKLQRYPLHLVEEAIEEYRERYKDNANCILCDFKGMNIRNLSCHMLFKHKEERSCWCLRCNALVEDLENHKKTHTGRIFCKFCKKDVTRCHFMEHLKTHAGVEFTYEMCCKRFIPQKALEQHRLLHKEEHSLQCHICQKPFKLLKNLEDHITTHGRYQCEICEKRFEIPELLVSHFCSGKISKSKNYESIDQALQLEYLTDPQKEEFCDAVPEQEECEEESVGEQNSKPSAIEDFKIESLTCHFCQRTYKTAYKLQKHIEGHMGIFSAKCKYCDKGFSNKADLANHERVHTKEKPFICSSCGKGFVSGATLRIHMKQHTGKPEECELCHKRFSRKSELKLHLQKHRGERPFLCTDCGKSFAQKSHLTCHLTMHSEERPYPCTVCDKAFKKKELLKHHLKLHGEKSFKCTVCLYECHKRYRLQQHMKMHEGKSGLKTNPCQLCNRSFSGVSLLNVHMGNAHNVIV